MGRSHLSRTVRRRVERPVRRRVPPDVLRLIHRVRRRLRPDRYTDADPTKLVRIDPDDVDGSVLDEYPGTVARGVVEGGDWDLRSEPFDNRPVARAIRQRIDGDDWAETPLPRHILSQAERFGEAWGYDLPDLAAGGVEARCAAVDRLVASIRERGYRTQAELGDRDGRSHPNSAIDPVPRYDEIHVDVGRDGRLLWSCHGQHRLAIARTLDVPAVPVVVARRHSEWQRVRDAVRRGTRDPPEHPDLRDLIRRNSHRAVVE